MEQSSLKCVRMIRDEVDGIDDKISIEMKKHPHSVGCLIVSDILIIYLVFPEFTEAGWVLIGAYIRSKR